MPVKDVDVLELEPGGKDEKEKERQTIKRKCEREKCGLEQASLRAGGAAKRGTEQEYRAARRRGYPIPAIAAKMAAGRLFLSFRHAEKEETGPILYRQQTFPRGQRKSLGDRDG